MPTTHLLWKSEKESSPCRPHVRRPSILAYQSLGFGELAQLRRITLRDYRSYDFLCYGGTLLGAKNATGDEDQFIALDMRQHLFLRACPTGFPTLSTRSPTLPQTVLRQFSWPPADRISQHFIDLRYPNECATTP